MGIRERIIAVAITLPSWVLLLTALRHWLRRRATWLA